MEGVEIEEKVFIFDTFHDVKFKKDKYTDEEIKKILIENAIKRGAIPAMIKFVGDSTKMRLCTYITAENVGVEIAKKIGYLDSNQLIGDKVIIK